MAVSTLVERKTVPAAEHGTAASSSVAFRPRLPYAVIVPVKSEKSESVRRTAMRPPEPEPWVASKVSSPIFPASAEITPAPDSDPKRKFTLPPDEPPFEPFHAYPRDEISPSICAAPRTESQMRPPPA